VNGFGVDRCQPTLDVSANSPHGLTTFVTAQVSPVAAAVPKRATRHAQLLRRVLDLFLSLHSSGYVRWQRHPSSREPFRIRPPNALYYLLLSL
jgi:hypothetical protein